MTTTPERKRLSLATTALEACEQVINLVWFKAGWRSWSFRQVDHWDRDYLDFKLNGVQWIFLPQARNSTRRANSNGTLQFEEVVEVIPPLCVSRKGQWSFCFFLQTKLDSGQIHPYSREGWLYQVKIMIEAFLSTMTNILCHQPFPEEDKVESSGRMAT